MKLFNKPEPPFTPVGKITDVEIEGRRLKLQCVGATALVEAVSPDIVRLRVARGLDFEPDHSYAVVQGDWPDAHCEMSHDEENVIFTTQALHLRFNKNSFGIEATDSGDTPYARCAGSDKSGFRGEMPEIAFDAPGDELYFGLGEKTGKLNKRGKKWVMWNTDRPYLPWHDPLYQDIPFIIGSRAGRAWGIFFDNTFKTEFDVCKGDSGKWRWHAAGGEVNAYFIGGPTLKDVTRRFYKLVGGIPMPPRWGLGYHQSRYSYKTDAEVRRIARSLRDLEIPCDAIHLDIHYMRGYRDFTFEPKRFPNPKELTDDLRKIGIRIICIVDPGVKEDENWDVWRDGVKKKVFCEYDNGGIVIKYCWPLRAGWPDFGKQEAREWWGEQLRSYLDNGVAGFWNDMNEPSMWNGAFYLFDGVVPTSFYHGEGMMHTHFGELKPHSRCRNAYGLMENRASREGMLKARPDERPLVITRSGYAGVGRYAVMWTGDNFSTWAHLRMSVPMQLNLGLCAEPVCGPDIGGFVLSTNAELYARWVQLGAFYPFCRTHTAIHTRRQEPYSFGKRVEEIARRYITLRYRLMPFIYSLVWNSHLNGDPIWRPMSYEFPDDAAAAGLDDQFMFGSHLLIAPVMRRGSRERSIYLPDGTWTEYFSGDVKTGPAWINVLAPLENLPMYARGGGIIPMGPPMQYTDQLKTDPLTLQIYPGSGSFDLFEDDGISMQYEKGAFSKTPVAVEQNNRALKITVGKRAGKYEIPPRKINLQVHTGVEPQSVSLNGRVSDPSPLDRAEWNFDKGVATCSWRDVGDKVVIEIR